MPVADRVTADDVFHETARTGLASELVLEQMAGSEMRRHDGRTRGEGPVRDGLVMLHFALDQRDVDTMMQFSTDDSVSANPRGTLPSPAAVRAVHKVQQ